MFPLLKGSRDLELEILSYLDSGDILHSAVFNKAAYDEVNCDELWKDMYVRDFLSDKQSLKDDTFITVLDGYKEVYSLRRSDLKRNTASNSEQLAVVNNEIRTYKNTKRKQAAIDCFQLQFFLPLPFVAIFVSILLIALRMDGHDEINAYMCFAPLLLLVLYLIASLLIVVVVYSHRATPSAAASELWQYMSGPMRVLYSTRIAKSPVYTLVLLFSLCLLALQVVLIMLKLSQLDISWGLVFAPLWVLFSVFCFTPLIRCVDMTVFCTGLVVWVPLIILFSLLACKFDREETNSTMPRIRLADIFAPFWLLEAIFFIAALGSIAQAVANIRAEAASDYALTSVSICALFCFIVMPIVIFQVLISLKDDGADLSSVNCVVPLLLLLGFFLLWALIFVCFYRTPYEEYQAARAQQDIGRHVVWKV